MAYPGEIGVHFNAGNKLILKGRLEVVELVEIKVV